MRCGRGRGWGLGTRYLGSGEAINASRSPSGGARTGGGMVLGWRAVGPARGSRERPRGYAGAPGMASSQGAALPQTQAADAGGASLSCASVRSPGSSCARPRSSEPRGLSARRLARRPALGPSCAAPAAAAATPAPPAPVPFRSRRRPLPPPPPLPAQRRPPLEPARE